MVYYQINSSSLNIKFNHLFFEYNISTLSLHSFFIIFMALLLQIASLLTNPVNFLRYGQFARYGVYVCLAFADE